MKQTAISLYARPSANYEDLVSATLEALERAARAHPGAIVQATSLGVEDMVITDLIGRHDLAIAVATLDTGKLHDETLGLLPLIESTYGIRVERHAPVAERVVRFVREHGERAIFQSIESRKACCALRKLEPLERMLRGRSAWITGLRREQSSARAEVAAHESDERGRVKFNPLADWTWGDLWHHVALHEVPYNPLHDRFYPSIGCSPCTRAIALGEDFRAGRWWWEQEGAKECGLHAAPDRQPETVE